jgi:Lon protease-like protein
MRKRLPITTLIAAAALTYGLYPYVALSQLESAVRQGDPVSLAELIDWSAVRDAPIASLVNSLAMALPFEQAEKQALLEAATLEARQQALTALLRIGAADDEDNPHPVQ